MAISPSSAFVPALVQLPGEIRSLIRARRLRTWLHLALLLHLLALIHLLLTPLVLPLLIPLLIHLLTLLLALLGLPLLLHGALLLHELLVLAFALLLFALVLHLTLLLIKHAPLLLIPLLIESPLLFLLLLYSPGFRRSTVPHLRRAAVLESGLRPVTSKLSAGVRYRWSVLVRAEIPRAALRTVTPWKGGPHGARATFIVESWVAWAGHAGPVGPGWWWCMASTIPLTARQLAACYEPRSASISRAELIARDCADGIGTALEEVI